jgi:hypothetical protein
MSNDDLSKSAAAGARDGEPKKPYVKPAFRLEPVFETMALACGKINNTQSSCRANRRNS